MPVTDLELHHLSTGREVRISNPHMPLLPHYRVLDAGGTADPTPEEIAEILHIAYAAARRLAHSTLDDPGGFSLLFNGSSVRRRPWFHIHLIPARTRRDKWWALFVLSQKRWLRKVAALLRANVSST